MTTVVALGDSLTCGEGVGVQVPPEATWVALLAAAAPQGRLVRLAEPGARVRDVRIRQLPQVPDGTIVTLIAGLNDVARSGFDATGLRADLLWTLGCLTSHGAAVVLGRLHDPARMLPLPKVVAGVVRRRIETVNAAVDEASGWPAVHLLDLAEVAALAQPGGWSTDRIHPSRVGHQAIAAAAARALSQHDLRLNAVLPEPRVPAGPSTGASAWWALRHGVPYVARHVSEFGPPVLSALAHRT
jgi:lysophospholipase L1-like esterase